MGPAFGTICSFQRNPRRTSTPNHTADRELFPPAANGITANKTTPATCHNASQALPPSQDFCESIECNLTSCLSSYYWGDPIGVEVIEFQAKKTAPYSERTHSSCWVELRNLVNSFHATALYFKLNTTVSASIIPQALQQSFNNVLEFSQQISTTQNQSLTNEQIQILQNNIAILQYKLALAKLCSNLLPEQTSEVINQCNVLYQLLDEFSISVAQQWVKSICSGSTTSQAAGFTSAITISLRHICTHQIDCEHTEPFLNQLSHQVSKIITPPNDALTALYMFMTVIYSINRDEPSGNTRTTLAEALMYVHNYLTEIGDKIILSDLEQSSYLYNTSLFATLSHILQHLTKQDNIKISFLYKLYTFLVRINKNSIALWIHSIQEKNTPSSLESSAFKSAVESTIHYICTQSITLQDAEQQLQSLTALKEEIPLTSADTFSKDSPDYWLNLLLQMMAHDRSKPLIKEFGDALYALKEHCTIIQSVSGKYPTGLENFASNTNPTVNSLNVYCAVYEIQQLHTNLIALEQTERNKVLREQNKDNIHTWIRLLTPQTMVACGYHTSTIAEIYQQLQELCPSPPQIELSVLGISKIEQLNRFSFVQLSVINLYCTQFCPSKIVSKVHIQWLQAMCAYLKNAIICPSSLTTSPAASPQKKLLVSDSSPARERSNQSASGSATPKLESSFSQTASPSPRALRLEGSISSNGSPPPNHTLLGVSSQALFDEPPYLSPAANQSISNEATSGSINIVEILHTNINSITLYIQECHKSISKNDKDQYTTNILNVIQMLYNALSGQHLYIKDEDISHFYFPLIKNLITIRQILDFPLASNNPLELVRLLIQYLQYYRRGKTVISTSQQIITLTTYKILLKMVIPGQANTTQIGKYLDEIIREATNIHETNTEERYKIIVAALITISDYALAQQKHTKQLQACLGAIIKRCAEFNKNVFAYPSVAVIFINAITNICTLLNSNPQDVFDHIDSNQPSINWGEE